MPTTYRPCEVNPNSLAALCDGVDSVLTEQPPQPPGSELRRLRRTLFGVQLSTPPSPEFNEFRDLYNADGTCLTFRSLADLERVAGYPQDLALDIEGMVHYPQTVELNEPWMIGALGQERDIHFAFALYVQLTTTATTTYLDVGEDQFSTCLFSKFCRRNTSDYNVEYATRRARNKISCTPIFKQPKVFMLPVKQEGLAPNGKVHQAWYPWQVCANCLAVRAKGRCSLWAYSVQVKEPLVVYELQPGGVSEYDAVYGWFTDARDAFMGKDIGYYNS